MTTITTTIRRKKESSIIDDVQYWPEDEIMEIKFKGADYKYRYKNIDENLFEEICSAHSLGGFLTLKVFHNEKYEGKIVK